MAKHCGVVHHIPRKNGGVRGRRQNIAESHCFALRSLLIDTERRCFGNAAMRCSRDGGFKLNGLCELILQRLLHVFKQNRHVAALRASERQIDLRQFELLD